MRGCCRTPRGPVDKLIAVQALLPPKLELFCPNRQHAVTMFYMWTAFPSPPKKIPSSWSPVTEKFLCLQQQKKDDAERTAKKGTLLRSGVSLTFSASLMEMIWRPRIWVWLIPGQITKLTQIDSGKEKIWRNLVKCLGMETTPVS